MSDYRWNGNDPETTFGLTFRPGLDAELMKMPRLKDNGLSINWAGENGTERYHGSRKFDTRTLSIGCNMIASSEANLLSNFQNLKSFLLTNGEFNFDIVSRNKRYKVSYQDMSSITKVTPQFKGRSKVAISFFLTLLDDHPADNYTIS